MEMNYKPNSHKSKEAQREAAERPKLEKVISGNVTTKKKSGASKFLGEFISEDAKDVKSYVVTDIIIPGIKKGLFDIITKGADRIFYGKSGNKSGRSTADRVSYTKYWDPRNDDGRSRPVQTHSGFDYDRFTFDDRGDAEAVLERLDEMIATYKHATVADLYDLCDKTAPHTAHKYGWTNLSTATVTPVSDGYVIKFPRALPID